MVGLTVGLFGFPAKANAMSAEKLHACTALDISNFRPLKVNVSVLSDKGICTTHTAFHGGHTGACISMTLHVLFTPLLTASEFPLYDTLHM